MKIMKYFIVKLCDTASIVEEVHSVLVMPLHR